MRSGLPALGGGESSGQIRMSTHLYSKRKVCNLIFLGYKLIIRGGIEMKIYKSRPFALIYNAVIYLFGIAAVLVIAWVVSSGNVKISIGVAALVFLLMLFPFLSQMKMKIIVNGNTVTFITKKSSNTYSIDDCGFSSKIVNHDDLNLTVTDGTNTEYYDCSFLGYTKYMELLEDLKLTGDNQKSIKLETKK